MKIVISTDGQKAWASVLIEGISDAQRCVQELIGGTIIKMSLGSHSIYQHSSESFVNMQTAKDVFEDIYNRVLAGNPVVMNKNGGYQPLEGFDLAEIVEVDIPYEESIKDCLIKQVDLWQKTIE